MTPHYLVSSCLSPAFTSPAVTWRNGMWRYELLSQATFALCRLTRFCLTSHTQDPVGPYGSRVFWTAHPQLTLSAPGSIGQPRKSRAPGAALATCYCCRLPRASQTGRGSKSSTKRRRTTCSTSTLSCFQCLQLSYMSRFSRANMSMLIGNRHISCVYARSTGCSLSLVQTHDLVGSSMESEIAAYL